MLLLQNKDQCQNNPLPIFESWLYRQRSGRNHCMIPKQWTPCRQKNCHCKN